MSLYNRSNIVEIYLWARRQIELTTPKTRRRSQMVRFLVNAIIGSKCSHQSSTSGISEAGSKCEEDIVPPNGSNDLQVHVVSRSMG